MQSISTLFHRLLVQISTVQIIEQIFFILVYLAEFLDHRLAIYHQKRTLQPVEGLAGRLLQKKQASPLSKMSFHSCIFLYEAQLGLMCFDRKQKRH